MVETRNVKLIGPSDPAVLKLDLARFRNSILDSCRTLPSRSSLLWLVGLIVIAGSVSVHHGADSMWDLKNYHLYNPFASHHGRYTTDVAPAQAQSYLNPILDYPFFILIRYFNQYPRFVAFCMGIPEGFILWLIGHIARTILAARPFASRWFSVGAAVVIGGTGAGTFPLIGSTTGDVAVSLPVVASVAILVCGLGRVALDRRLSHGSVLAASFLGGIAVGAKLTMGCYAVGLLAALLVVVPLRDWPGTLVRFAAATGLGLLATGGYHSARMLRLFGSPVFPFFNGFIRSPFFIPVTIREDRFYPKTWLDALFYPFEWATDATHAYVSEIPFRDIRIALVVIAIAVLVMGTIYRRLSIGGPAKRIPPVTAFLVVYVVASYAVWLKMFSVYRYLLPLEMLSGVVLVAVLTCVVRPLAVPLLMAAAAGACWATTVPLEWGHTPFHERYIEVDAPTLAPGTLVLVVGDSPVSFVVPFMEPSATWLSLDDNFINPTQDSALVRSEHDIIERHRGPMAVIAVNPDNERVSSVMAHYGLRADIGTCRSVRSNLGGEVFQMCVVNRVSS